MLCVQTKKAGISPDTILAIEIAHWGIPWAAPGDLPLDAVDQSILKGIEGTGVLALFADGSLDFVWADVPLDDFKTLCTLEGAKQAKRELILGASSKSR